MQRKVSTNRTLENASLGEGLIVPPLTSALLGSVRRERSAHAVLLICIGLLLASACVIALPPLRRRAASMVYGE